MIGLPTALYIISIVSFCWMFLPRYFLGRLLVSLETVQVVSGSPQLTHQRSGARLTGVVGSQHVSNIEDEQRG